MHESLIFMLTLIKANGSIQKSKTQDEREGKLKEVIIVYLQMNLGKPSEKQPNMLKLLLTPQEMSTIKVALRQVMETRKKFITWLIS
jgi:hypothetical protein